VGGNRGGGGGGGGGVKGGGPKERVTLRITLISLAKGHNETLKHGIRFLHLLYIL